MISTSTLVNSTRQNDAVTANGAVTNSTSLNANVDLFFLAGASRGISEVEIQKAFLAALIEDAQLAIRLMFWARDVREGAGERRFFQICLNYLNTFHPELTLQVYNFIPEFGRWDDLFMLLAGSISNEVLESIKVGLDNKNGLLAKWLPRKGAVANKVRRYLKLSPKNYRQLVVSLSKTLEQDMCSKQWSKIEYSTVPSVASNKYRKAFARNDNTRYVQYLTDVNNGEAKINSSAIFPHDIVKSLRISVLGTRSDRYLSISENNATVLSAIETQWKSLPDYMSGAKKRILPVCDVSASMTQNGGLPFLVSLSLGLYMSERNESIFKDSFITFSRESKMYYLQGSLRERILQISENNMDTNIESVFSLILGTALKHNLKQEDMPDSLVIISDMEFNKSGVPNQTAYETIVQRYKESGYEIPELIFWNVNGRPGNVPVKASLPKTALVSGFSPSILKSIMSGDDLTPTGVMLSTLNAERYKQIMIK